MPSPFPGMDPYLEAHWGDVHTRVIVYASDALQRSLPRELRARVEERVSVETPDEKARTRIPDVRVIEDLDRPRKRRPSAADGVAVAEPFVIPADEPVTKRFIEIRDIASGNKVVTVIEVLSPTNKLAGPGRAEYLDKREELRAGRVNLAEIDLLRSGPRPYPFHVNALPVAFHTPYQAWVRRAATDDIEVYRISLRESLPNIRIPLRPDDRDAILQLQPLIEKCYENGDYAGEIDYERDPEPPLEGADARWADGLLRKAGRRKRRAKRR